MDNKTAIPPYEANPNSIPQHAPMHTANSYGSTPGQPTMQHDIYQNQPQQPISPTQTGTTINNYPNQPPGSPPPQTNALYGQPQMAQPQAMGSPTTPLDHPKGDYYSREQQQVPMQQIPTQPLQPQTAQYHTATPLQNLQEGAAPVDCPVCHARAMTRPEFHSGNTTHAWGLVICCIFWLGCIPYMIRSLKDVEHHCGHCGVLLATWHRSGRTVVHQHH